MVNKEDQPHNPGTRQHVDTKAQGDAEDLHHQRHQSSLRTTFLGQTWQRALQERQHLTATVILQAIISCFLVQTTTLP